MMKSNFAGQTMTGLKPTIVDKKIENKTLLA